MRYWRTVDIHRRVCSPIRGCNLGCSWGCWTPAQLRIKSGAPTTFIASPGALDPVTCSECTYERETLAPFGGFYHVSEERTIESNYKFLRGTMFSYPKRKFRPLEANNICLANVRVIKSNYNILFDLSYIFLLYYTLSIKDITYRAAFNMFNIFSTIRLFAKIMKRQRIRAIRVKYDCMVATRDKCHVLS